MRKTIFPTLLLFCSVNTLFAQMPTGSIAKYTLNNNALDGSGNGYNGTLTSTTATTNRFSTASAATAFTSGSSSGTLPVALVTATQNDFSINFWFKSSMTASSSSQWYGGNSLIDAEVGGVTNDWGICLIDGGKVCFGVGNPDITIKSTTATYNDGIWHFVTATRNKSAGSIFLYVDGVQVATTTGINTAALNAPAVIGLGRSSAVSTGTFTGSLDDILVYNRVLTSTEVNNLYNAEIGVPLAVNFISFNGAVNNNTALLNWMVTPPATFTTFDIEQSSDGIHFSTIGNLTSAAGITNNNALSFNYTVALTGSINYYRIKQSDGSGTPVYSAVISLKNTGSNSGLYLKDNPVANTIAIVNSNSNYIQSLQVIDETGRIVLNKKIESASVFINCDAFLLPSGFYFLKLTTVAGNQSLPFVKL
ncbi:MAG: T9SS type A sorting domain-containing protein [Bacteroidetes bacterium]|nr:T9SS type A sorting domain-containing protein [Bacteroidota bacterium]